MQFHIFHKDVDYPEGENAILEPEDADPRHQVKVLLLAHGGKTEVLKKALGLLPDGSTDDNHEVTSVFKQLQILVGEFNFVFHIYDKYSFSGTRGKENMAIGGSWSPSLDGADPTDPRTLIKTAIRTTKALTGVDLSGVPQWSVNFPLALYSPVHPKPGHLYHRHRGDSVPIVHTAFSLSFLSVSLSLFALL